MVAAGRSLSPGMACVAVLARGQQGWLKRAATELQAAHCFALASGAVDDASRKFSRHLACEGCRAMPSGWQLPQRESKEG